MSASGYLQTCEPTLHDFCFGGSKADTKSNRDEANMRPSIIGVLAAVLAGVFTPAAAAGEISSAYTTLDLDKCPVTKTFADSGGSVRTCEGYGGLPVQVAEDDLRYFVWYGDSDQTAARQTLTHFNTIHSTLEWRIERRDGVWQPFATILRYSWEQGDNGPKGETLVVIKLAANDACHVAYLRADGNPKANETAREIADGRARTFDCKQDEPATVPR